MKNAKSKSNLQVHFSSASNEWATPQYLFKYLDDTYHYTLDPCCTKETAKCIRYFTQADDGLKQNWGQSLLPLKSLCEAQLLINALPLVEDVHRNFIVSKCTSATDTFKGKSNASFGAFYDKMRLYCSQKLKAGIPTDSPSPTDSFVQLTRLLTSNAADTVRLEQEFNRRLVNHLDENIKAIVGGLSLAFLVNGVPLMDANASFAVNKSGGPTNGTDWNILVHTLIIHSVRGLITNNYVPDVVFCNPPYGRSIGEWVKKAYEESLQGAIVSCLIPARTDTKWWRDYCLKADNILFLTGRVKFVENGVALKAGAPFPSAIVTFKPNPLNLPVRCWWKDLSEIEKAYANQSK